MGKLFFPKLAAGNLVRNRQFIFPYLLTGLLTAAMFYNVAFLTWSPDLSNMPGAANIQSIMYVGTVVVGLFAVIFLLYTNSFLMKRRQKEIGLYNILGMSKGHIALILFWETVYTCLITIGGGLLLGILLSKLLILLLFKLLYFTVHFGFSVSPSALGVTAALFAGINLLALAKNLLHVRLSRPVELLKGGNVGEKEPKTKKLLTLLGVLTIGAGYFIALTTESPLDAIMLFFVAVVLVIVGTYCLFTAGSIALLKALKKKKNYYYQPKHFIGVSGMLYRMKQNAVGLANICILSTMVLVMLSTCFCMYIGVDDAVSSMYPHDMTFSQMKDDPDRISEEEYETAVLAQVQAAGLTVEKAWSWHMLSMNMIQEGDRFTLIQREDALGQIVFTEIITQAGYEAATGEKLNLQPGQAAVYSTEEIPDTFTLLDSTFQVLHRLDESPTEGYSAYSSRRLSLVVPDENALEALYQQQFHYVDMAQNVEWQLNLDFAGASDQEILDAYNETVESMAEHYSQPDYGENGEVTGIRPLSVYSECQQDGKLEVYSIYGGLLFLGLFLGFLFLMATVLIIYYKQISEGYEDKERFAIMEKVGMSQQQVRTAIRSQVRTVFFLPLAGAVIHLAAAFKMITKLMAALHLDNVPLFALTSLCTVAVFALGYLIIYTFTARTYYKIVR